MPKRLEFYDSIQVKKQREIQEKAGKVPSLDNIKRMKKLANL
ncbi:MAG TPA: hypothetical protein PLI46_02335 [Methanosarcina thermophila]|jgi:hypothetical protein|nr:hypothetical protein [Methanosarcina thermophila]